MNNLLQMMASKLIHMMTPYIQDALAAKLDDLIDQAEPKIQQRIESIIEKAMEEYDFSDHIAEAVGNHDLEREIERAVEAANISEKVEEAIEGEDIEGEVRTAIEDEMDRWTFEDRLQEKMEEVARQEYLKIIAAQHEAVRTVLTNF